MEKAFIEMDSDADGTVTEAEFVKACLNNRCSGYLFIFPLNRFLLIFVALEKGFLFIFFIRFEKFLSSSFRPFDSLTDLGTLSKTF